MRPIDGDALEKDLRESHDQLREIYNGLKYDDDRQICAGQLTTFIEAILRIKDAPTIDQYGTWIPCSERLPKEPEENPEFDGKPLELYLVSVNDEKYPFRAFWNGKCFTDGAFKVNAIAWMPLPEPYRGEKKDE